MNDYIKDIIDVGFPIVLSLYLLIRLESKLDKLSENIIQLSLIIDKKINFKE